MRPSPFPRCEAAATSSPPAYAETRDSGVEWLGEVPSHWGVQRLKRLMDDVNEGAPDDGDRDWGSAGCLALEDVESWTGRCAEGQPASSYDSELKHYRTGDILFGKLRPYLAKVARAGRDGYCVGEFLVLRARNKESDPAFLDVMLRSQPLIQAVNGSTFGARMPRANWGFLGQLPVPLPPPAEQAAIVRCLDYVARRIRRYIQAKEKLIELLEQQQQVVVHQAVTGQIDVRTGQPYPAYKDSGIEWLGKTPTHWRMSKIRQCAAIAGGMTPSMEDRRFWGGDVPWVTPKDMKTRVIAHSLRRVTATALAATTLRLVQSPAVLMVVRGMILARKVPIALTAVPVTINQDMKALVPLPALDPAYLAAFLDCAHDGLFALIDEAGHGTRRLPTERWRDLPLPVPPQAEQTAICRHVDGISGRTTAATGRARQQVALLREFRTRLIADVVTGKLDVREVAASLPVVAPLEAEVSQSAGPPCGAPASSAPREGECPAPAEHRP